MDIGKALRDSWELFAKDALALIVASLIVLLLGTLSLGIVLVPLVAGLYLMIMRRVREGRPAEIGDVFACFDRFGDYFLAFLVFLAIGFAFAAVLAAPVVLAIVAGVNHVTGLLVLGILVSLVVLACEIALGLYLGTIWLYVLPLMIDRRVGVIDGMRGSRRLVSEKGFWITLALYLIVSLIAGGINSVAGSVVGAVTFGFGGFLSWVISVVVLPWEIAAFLAMYFQAIGEGAWLPTGRPPGTDWQGGGTATPKPVWPGAQPGSPVPGPPPGQTWQAPPPPPTQGWQQPAPPQDPAWAPPPPPPPAPPAAPSEPPAPPEEPQAPPPGAAT
jgi:hypothetical protein